MPGCGDKLKKSNGEDTSRISSNQAGKNETPAPTAASFSMAHALSMLRQRQKDQENTQKMRKDKASEEKLKEKAREKRRRRRKNQKLARAKYKAKLAKTKETNEISKSSNSESQEVEADDINASAAIEDANEEASNEIKGIAQTTELKSDKRKEHGRETFMDHLPMKKRFTKRDAHQNSRQASLNYETKSEVKTNYGEKKINTFIPRAIMLKKKKET